MLMLIFFYLKSSITRGAVLRLLAKCTKNKKGDSFGEKKDASLYKIQAEMEKGGPYGRST